MSRRSLQDWKQLIHAQQSSELNIQAFCQTHGITSSNFYLWRKRLRDRNSTPEFVQLETEATIESTEADIQWRAEVDLGHGIILKVR